MNRSRRFEVAYDALYGALMTAMVLGGSIGESGAHDGRSLPYPGPVGYTLVVAASLVLVWRRRWPVATFWMSLACVLIYTMLGYMNGAALIAPTAGVFVVATTGSARRALSAAALALVTLMGASWLFSPFGAGGPLPIIPFEIATAAALGMVLAIRNAYVAEIRDRAERAERSRDEEARRRVDAERLRIARELHDAVAHSISVINIQSRVAAQVITDPPAEGARALAAIKEASIEALRELRSILGLLRQAGEAEPTAPAPGMDQLDVLVSATGRAGLSVDLAVLGEPYRLPPTVDVAAYRIVQESLTNALRYAGTATVTVSVRYAPDGVVIEVDDDGQGVDGDRSAAGRWTARTDGLSASGSGHGIAGMRERATAAGGTLDAGPKAQGGFLVRARLPVVTAS